MKFQVCLYQETYTTVEIEATDEGAARDLVMSGEFSDGDISDVTVKNSEIITVTYGVV